MFFVNPHSIGDEWLQIWPAANEWMNMSEFDLNDVWVCVREMIQVRIVRVPYVVISIRWFFLRFYFGEERRIRMRHNEYNMVHISEIECSSAQHSMAHVKNAYHKNLSNAINLLFGFLPNCAIIRWRISHTSDIPHHLVSRSPTIFHFINHWSKANERWNVSVMTQNVLVICTHSHIQTHTHAQAKVLTITMLATLVEIW